MVQRKTSEAGGISISGMSADDAEGCVADSAVGSGTEATDGWEEDAGEECPALAASFSD